LQQFLILSEAYLLKLLSTYKTKFFVVTFLAVALLACRSAHAQSAATVASDATMRPIPGFDQSSLDLTADPCTDFYKFACGNFAKNHPIPGDMPFTAPYMVLRQYNTQLLRDILEKASKGGLSRTPNAQKIGDFYAACMNTDLIEKDGTKNIKTWLDRIDAVKNPRQLSPLVGAMQRFGVSLFFGYGEETDFKNSDKQIAVADQTELGLPEKGYYTRTGAKDIETRKQYVEHVAKMLQLLGESADASTADANAVLAMETELAKASMSNVERREPTAVYHIETMQQLQASAPIIDFAVFSRMTGAPIVTSLNVAVPAYFPALNKVLTTTSLSTLKAYMKYELLTSVASRLPKAFDVENFDFYGKKLEGETEQAARWKRCSNATDGSLGEALGQVYVNQYFSAANKAQMLAMAKTIEAAMSADLDQIDWMSAATKVKAKEKLHLVTEKIGYPDKWRDYSSLIINADDPMGDLLRARIFENDREFNKIGKPVDRTEWEMSPPTVNAYYSDTTNSINFPAGYLQPPNYDTAADDAVNYGHIGETIGHELTHGFDDKGAEFDGHGNLVDWWSPEDEKNFKQRTDCIADEYDHIVVVDDLHVNGKLTLGEDTADNGGTLLAYMAYMQLAKEKHIDLTAKTDGFTPEQRFYIGYAQNWCSNWRPAMLRWLVQNDAHPPDAARVNGVLQNQPAFGHVFGCKVGAPMVPVKSCRVW